MEYRLEIYRPGSCRSDGCIQTFTAGTPFLPIRVGDLLNTKTWGKDVQWPLLRVLNVEHVISSASAAGIDPSGNVTHQILLYTESVPDADETRCRPV